MINLEIGDFCSLILLFFVLIVYIRVGFCVIIVSVFKYFLGVGD